MDTNQIINTNCVEKALQMANMSSFFEAFLEAGPQLVLQLSIIIRIGFICK